MERLFKRRILCCLSLSKWRIGLNIFKCEIDNVINIVLLLLLSRYLIQLLVTKFIYVFLYCPRIEFFIKWEINTICHWINGLYPTIIHIFDTPSDIMLSKTSDCACKQNILKFIKWFGATLKSIQGIGQLFIWELNTIKHILLLLVLWIFHLLSHQRSLC